MICLGIESTAHTFGVGIMDDKGNVLASEKAVYTTKEGGMIPDVVAGHSREHADEVLLKALKKANLAMDSMDLISYARGPGLSPCLLVGRNKAVELAKAYNKPLAGINHCVAHLTIGKLMTGTKDPVYLYVSGVNTQVIALEGKKYRIFGETLDLALGNAMDKLGRAIGLGFPAGPKIEELARKGKLVNLPYAVKGMDASFSGIVTKAEQLLKKGIPIEDICYSFQEVCFAMMIEVTERALAHTGKNEVVLIGGVAANKRFCEMLKIMCSERKADFEIVSMEYCSDNGAMIAWQGILEKDKTIKPEEADIKPYERTDEVEAGWED